jgi:hypothetical protein
MHERRFEESASLRGAKVADSLASKLLGPREPPWATDNLSHGNRLRNRFLQRCVLKCSQADTNCYAKGKRAPALPYSSQVIPPYSLVHEFFI